MSKSFILPLKRNNSDWNIEPWTMSLKAAHKSQFFLLWWICNIKTSKYSIYDTYIHRTREAGWLSSKNNFCKLTQSINSCFMIVDWSLFITLPQKQLLLTRRWIKTTVTSPSVQIILTVTVHVSINGVRADPRLWDLITDLWHRCSHTHCITPFSDRNYCTSMLTARSAIGGIYEGRLKNYYHFIHYQKKNLVPFCHFKIDPIHLFMHGVETKS